MRETCGELHSFIYLAAEGPAAKLAERLAQGEEAHDAREPVGTGRAPLAVELVVGGVCDGYGTAGGAPSAPCDEHCLDRASPAERDAVNNLPDGSDGAGDGPGTVRNKMMCRWAKG